MSITVYETSGELADERYLQALVSDLAANPPREEFAMLCCSICGAGPIVCSGLCNSCAWAELYEPDYDYEPPACYDEKHGA